MNLKIISKIVERKKFHLLVLTSSIFFLLFTSVNSNPGAPESSVFWYASELHWSFWPGLMLSFFAILISIRHRRKYLGLLSVLIPVFYLYALPSLIHDMLPVFDVYHVIPSVLSIVETGSWNMQSIPFPGSHIYQAMSIMILDLEAMTYAKIFPTSLAFSMAIFIYTIARRISTRWAPIAPVVFLSLNWYMEYHLARQPFSVMLWTAFWLALFLYLDKRTYRLGIAAGLILFALIPSHPGMLIIVSFNMAALTVITFISFRDQNESEYFFPFMPLLLVFGIGAALFYVSVPAISEYMDSVYDRFMEGAENSAMEISLGGPAATSLQYEFVNRLRMLAGGLHSLLGLLGFVAIYRKVSKRALLLGAWFFSIFLWLVYPLTQDGHYIERALLSSLIPASILAVALLKHCWPNNFDLRNLFQVSVIVIIAAFLILVPVTKNSIDTIETPSRPSYKAGIFAENNFDGRVYVTDTHHGMFRYIESTEGEDHSTTWQFRSRSKTPPDQPYGYRIPRTDRHLSPILFTDYFNNYIEIRYGNTTAVEEIKQYETQISQDSHRIYDSRGSRIYLET